MRVILFLTGLVALAGFVAAAEPGATPGDGPALLDGSTEIGRLHASGKDLAKPYIWPLTAPGNVAVTRAWPMDKTGAKSTDHVHQKSAWFCHGDVIPEGVTLKQKVKGVDGVDFWAEAAGHGVIVCKSLDHAGNRYTLTNEWRTADGTKILDERRTITARDLGGARLLVFDIELQANDSPVTFGDTKEGAFGVRVNDQMAIKTGQGTITNAEGKTGEKACWGYPSKWCDYSGTVDGKPVGIAIFDDPANPYPSCWHVRDYGLMAANPFGRGKSGFPAMKGRSDLVKMAKGDRLKFRYGILTHTGDAQSGRVAEHFETFLKAGKAGATE
jgi:hypothetical protein